MREQKDYYTKTGASPLDCFKEGLISRQEYIGFCKGNIIKYVTRYDKKGGKEDLLKAKDYVDELLDLIGD